MIITVIIRTSCVALDVGLLLPEREIAVHPDPYPQKRSDQIQID